MAPVTVAPSTTVFPVSDVTVLTSGFAWGETGARVRLLQQVLGVDVDGVYGPGTRSRHLSVLVSRGLSTGGVPGLPATTTVAPTTTTTTTTVAPATTTTTSTTTTVAPATTTSTTSTTTTVAPATTTTTTTTTTTSTTTTTTTTTTTLAPTNGATAVSSSVAGHLPVRSNSQWTFIPADRRSLTVSVATTDFSSRIKVYDPNVVLLRTSVASGEKNSSVLLLSGDLCVDGEYTIVVESRIDYHSGNFTLTLTPGTELWDLAKPSC